MAATAATATAPRARFRLPVLRVWRAVAVAGFAALVAHLAFGVGGPGLDHFANRWLYDSLELLAAVGCLLRAATIRDERAAWCLLGLGVLSFSLGDVCFDFVYGGSPPGVSICEGFYLAFYPACYAGLALLVRSRISSFDRSVWLDGAVAALGAAAVSSAFVLQDVIDHTHDKRWQLIVDFAYPVADLVLLVMVILVFVLAGRGAGRAWASAALAFCVITLADSIYLYVNANGSYHEGTLLDALWPAGLLLLAVAAWQPVERDHGIELEGRPFAGIPLVCGLGALGVLVDSRFHHHPIADGIAVTAILAVFIRTTLSLRDNARLLESVRVQSLTDHLTGLGNRRSLMLALERELTPAGGRPKVLIIFDLNGFKRYNDTFGHLSGDALLERLAGRLELAVAGAGGRAFRLGGDEFCVLVPSDRHGVELLIDAGVSALSEEGDGFRIGAEHGAVLIPEEATDPTVALTLADERLYAQKYTLYRGGEKSHQILLRALNHHGTARSTRSENVGDLARLVGERLGVSGHALEQLGLAAELHEIGKLAAPDPVLQIVAVCDAYATMTSDGRGRRALSRTAALAELRRCAGTQFDREVVFAFCRLHEEALRDLPEQPTPIRAVG